MEPADNSHMDHPTFIFDAGIQKLIKLLVTPAYDNHQHMEVVDSGVLLYDSLLLVETALGIKVT